MLYSRAQIVKYQVCQWFWCIKSSYLKSFFFFHCNERFIAMESVFWGQSRNSIRSVDSIDDEICFDWLIQIWWLNIGSSEIWDSVNSSVLFGIVSSNEVNCFTVQFLRFYSNDSFLVLINCLQRHKMFLHLKIIYEAEASQLNRAVVVSFSWVECFSPTL